MLPTPSAQFARKYSFILRAAIVIPLWLLLGASVYAVCRTGLLPAKYVWLCSLAAGTIVVGLTVGWVKGYKRLCSRILLTVASLIFLVGAGYTLFIAHVAHSFLHTVYTQRGELIEFAIVTRSNGDTSMPKTIGFTRDEAFTEKAFAALSLKRTSHRAAEELTTLLTRTAEGATDAAILRTAQLRLVQENNPDLYARLRQLRTAYIKVSHDKPLARLSPDKPFILYISGIDTYGDMTTVSRSDVNILAAVNPKTHRILLVTTPRDYYVQLHGTTGLRDKLTHAGIYGIDSSRQTLEDLYGISIERYLRINFSSLTAIVDALGGIDVASPYSFSAGPYRFNAGMNHLDGKQALAFSRERYAFEAGDRTRGQNQEIVIESIISKLNNPTKLLHFQPILHSLKDTFETNLSEQDIAGFTRDQLNTMVRWRVQSLAVDGRGEAQPTYSMGSQLLYVMQPDLNSLQAVQNAIHTMLEEKI